MARKKLTTRIKESSWQTSLASLLVLAGTGTAIYGQVAGRPDIAAIGQNAALLFGGGGLLAAKDANKL